MNGHEHHHHHEHGHDHVSHASEHALLWGLILTLGFAAVEATGGWISGSLALLSDAAHMLSDATALGLAALAARFARLPPSPRHSYGLVRAEVLSALFNGVFMLLVIAGIVWHAVARLRDPTPVDGGLVIAIAAAGMLVNVLIIWVLHRGEQNLNVRGAMIHVIGDLLGSVAALIAGLVIHFTGWMPIDPLLSFLICALILFSCLRLLRDVVHVIMEGVPAHLELPTVGKAMAGVPGVREVHDLHIWTLSSGRNVLSAHVVIEDMRHWETILEAMRRLLHDRFGLEHVTLQPEPAVRANRIHPM
ncbi:MAG: cation diffusion facilitator family transporter [Gammaproteobacteria bacterium]|jgi:cobalt-zinc-cadmium efflux system protein|nr:cation diffusion facilitator family transporter [Gammaproteobacteria bacterium]